MNIINKKILVTGATGFLGRYIVEELKRRKVPAKNIIELSSKNDLRKRSVCKKVVDGVDVVIHAAGKVGGIGFNRDIPGEIFYDNLMMGVQLMEEARLAGVKKFVAIGTVCSYPKLTPVPFKEKDLWNGYPEETNAPYGLAKKMLLVQAHAYRVQYKFNAIYLMPVNLYGPGDTSTHVIPQMIEKFLNAKKNNLDEVVVWGTGRPTREFLFAKDAARGIVDAAVKYNGEDPVNLGAGNEISIKELAVLIKKITSFSGKIVWDKSKPDGQPRRKLSTLRAKKEFGFSAHVSFEKGLEETVKWYINQKA